MAASDARPVPKKNTAFRLYFDIRKNDGTLITTWAGQDTELSLDGGNYSDATNEATEIQTSGTGYIDLTAAEMNYDSVIVKITVTNTDALPVVVVLFPEEAGDIRTDATQISGDSTAADNLELMFDGTGYAGGTTKLAVDASASAVASVTGAVGSVTGAVGSVTGTVGSVASYGTLVADVATAVWAAGTRTLTSFGTLVADIWAGVTTAFLAKFSTQDTGETTPVAGSVAKLAQGSASMTEADIWAYATRTLTQSAAQVAAVVAGSTLTVQRGDTLSASLTGLGDITGRLKLWWTVKGDTASADTAALVMIEETAGLVYLNGAAGTAIQGDITVDDQSAGDITITLAATATAALPPGSYSYDVQWATATGAIHTLTSGTARIVADVTRATA